jgi:hypothetical protein
MITRNTDQLRTEVRRHLDADAVIQRTYWNGSQGCFIGCLAHSSDASELERRYGLPLPVVRIAESIFEALPADEARAFFGAIPDVVRADGRDLTRVTWRFLAQVLRELHGPPEISQTVIEGMDRLGRGEEWPEAADAADAYAACACAYAACADAYAACADAADADAAAYARDARAAAAAADAACAAAYAGDARAAAAAARAAYAARAAASQRQRDILLTLLADA